MEDDTIGIAFLPDGRRLDYEEYLKTPEWRQKKANRLAFDNWQCAICHADCSSGCETHHLNYLRLGHEDIEKDLISICKSCHELFHETWAKTNNWDSSPLSHWKTYDLKHTARLCVENIEKDFMFGGELNCCNLETIASLIDDYYDAHGIEEPIYFCEDDIRLFFRNIKYDILFEADANGEGLDDMLDRMFGQKTRKDGGNPTRAEARRFFTKHKIPAMKRIYSENQNILILMGEVKKLKEIKSNAET